MVRATSTLHFISLFYQLFVVPLTTMNFLLPSYRFYDEIHITTNRGRDVFCRSFNCFGKCKMVNPAYYGLENAEVEMLNSYLSRLVQTTFEDVEDSGCIKIDGENVEPLVLGTIASQYYLSSMTISICFCISYLVLQKMMNFPCGITRKITMKHYQEEFDI
uniref:MER3 helicase-like winged helix domain-containing protein n=1 Tax=Salix viminalis TaxID=40686 RepID=A0A6N2NB10_SALVM